MRALMAPAAILLALLFQPADLGARERANVPAASRAEGTARARAGSRKPRIVHLPSPSEESPEQRDRRLARECRGLPNAGACLGHALARPRKASARQ